MSDIKLYVAETGSDENKGAQDSPLKSVIAALFINDKVSLLMQNWS